MSEDFDKIAKFEKAIEKKYGKDAVQNPKRFWSDSKEKKFLKERKLFYEKIYSKKPSPVKNRNKYNISSKFENKTDRNCPVCRRYLFLNSEGAYLSKYECCKKCYIKYVEGREDRWESGWRPEQ
jgi:hypothetical protein